MSSPFLVPAATQKNPSVGSTEATPFLQEGYERYRALGLKLHMLADEIAENAAQQDILDSYQRDCLAGQKAILKEAGDHIVATNEEALLMMALWSEDIRQGREDNSLCDTDRMALKIFEFVQDKMQRE